MHPGDQTTTAGGSGSGHGTGGPRQSHPNSPSCPHKACRTSTDEALLLSGEPDGPASNPASAGKADCLCAVATGRV